MNGCIRRATQPAACTNRHRTAGTGRLTRHTPLPCILLGALFLASTGSSPAQEVVLPVVPERTQPAATPLPGTTALEWSDDASTRMINGIDEFLSNLLVESVKERSRYWKRDFTSRSNYDKSVQANRDRLRRIIGAVDERHPNPTFEFTTAGPKVLTVAESSRMAVYAVRWPVFAGVYGEGLLLQPKAAPIARLVVLPDADQTPEMMVGLTPGVPPETQFARVLAEAGCQVLVPTLVSREDQWSGNTQLKKFTNQPHREWIYRQAYELGRHIIGYEVQKTLAALDCLQSLDSPEWSSDSTPRLGLAGYGEGGLIALYASALDLRVDATFISGYFGPREKLWEEPIYRNVFGLLGEFGDAEIATLIAPRYLVIEYSECPQIAGPPQPRDARRGAAPGVIVTPSFREVQSEAQRTQAFFPADRPFPMTFVHGTGGTTIGPGSPAGLRELLVGLGAALPSSATNFTERLVDARPGFNPTDRQGRQVEELVRFTHDLALASEQNRNAFFWDRLTVDRRTDWNAIIKDYRRYFWDEIIGRLPPPSVGANPRSRKILEKTNWDGYELMLDVWPGVFSWSYVLIPKDLRSGDRRPVVVCQHGLEGLPEDLVSNPGDSSYGVYKALASRLADRGFVVVIPHNPYRGGDRFRSLQRKANPLKKTLYSVIAGQHERLVQFLSVQAYIDPKRIAFYGLAYGGRTAMRIPAILDGYALSICSGDFTEWIWKNALTDSPYSYAYTGEYEMPEFNLANTFNYAEMAALIAPRPFMVERGHDDPTSPDEWVAAEYAKVRRFYTKLGYPERTTIEFFDGAQTINGVSSFQFLYRHLDFTRR